MAPLHQQFRRVLPETTKQWGGIMADDSTKKLGVIPLAALVVSAMIGGGIFSLPQNMAQGQG